MGAKVSGLGDRSPLFGSRGKAPVEVRGQADDYIIIMYGILTTG